MFGSWTSAAAKCKNKRLKLSTATSTADLTAIMKKSKDISALITATNSSNQLPMLAGLHNAYFQSHQNDRRSTHLLSLPLTVRLKIWRQAVISTSIITVSAQEKERSAEPALLSVCRAIREEARPIFYCENEFEMMAYRFDVLALLPWVRKAEGAAEAWKELGTHGEKGSMFWTTDGRPHWANLVGWLRLYHEGKIVAYEGTRPEEMSIAAVFDIVKGFRGQEWEKVEMMLPGLRKMLVAVDEEWGVDGGEEGGKGMGCL